MIEIAVTTMAIIGGSLATELPIMKQFRASLLDGARRASQQYESYEGKTEEAARGFKEK